jgi:hypothetical protein
VVEDHLRGAAAVRAEHPLVRGRADHGRCCCSRARLDLGTKQAAAAAGVGKVKRIEERGVGWHL